MGAPPVTAPFYRPRSPVTGARLRLCSDEQLVARYRSGRDEAFGVIHERYRARLRAYVRQMLGGRSSEDVEDVLQDVFERAARTLQADVVPLGLRAWLYSVAHNRCIDELRRRPPASPDVLAASRLPSGDTSAVAERRADVERLFRDLRALPELQRSALLMRELQGLSHAELARALDASVPAVKSLLVRARVGLVDAEEARGIPCAKIREDLAGTHDRRVKASAQAARHLLECPACRAYRAELRQTSRRLAALVPGPTLLAALGRLLGGAGGHLDGSLAATGMAGSAGATIAGAGKLAVLLGAATVVTTGAVLDQEGALPWSSPAPAHRVAANVTARVTSRSAAPPTGHSRTSAGAPAVPAKHVQSASPVGRGSPAAAPPTTAGGSVSAPGTPSAASTAQPPADHGAAGAAPEPAAVAAPAPAAPGAVAGTVVSPLPATPAVDPGAVAGTTAASLTAGGLGPVAATVTGAVSSLTAGVTAPSPPSEPLHRVADTLPGVLP